MSKDAPALTVTWDGDDISNDITSMDFATPRGVQDVTGVDKAYVERLLLLADFSATFNGPFNDAADRAHAQFKTVPSVSATVTLTIAASGQTLGSSMGVFPTDYQLSKAITGELTYSVPVVLGGDAAPAWS